MFYILDCFSYRGGNPGPPGRIIMPGGGPRGAIPKE